MNTLFKKHFWIVNLVGIGVIAVLVAGAITDVIAHKLFVTPSAPTIAPDDLEVSDAEDALAGRVANEREAVAALSARRIFDLTPPEPEEEEPEPVVAEVEEEPEIDPDGDLEESSLALDLIGTMVAADQASSMATMVVEGENKLAWIDSQFLEGKATIVKIAPRHVVVRESDRYTVVRLWPEPEGEGDKSGRSGRRPTPSVSNKRPPTVSSARARPTSLTERTKRSQAMREGISKSGAYEYEVSREMLDEELEDLGRLQSEARVVPHYRNQQYEGFKLVGVRPGSLYRALGIRSGDVIKSVNGTAIDSPNKALTLFESLKNSSDIKVEIERRGQPRTLGYGIK